MTSMSLLKRIFRRKSERTPPPRDDERPWWEGDEPNEDAGPPDAPVIERVVNNRVFLLGLDELYRTAIQEHEHDELLSCALHVTSALNIQPADVPVEGYYAEDEELTSYFRMMKALQKVPLSRASNAYSPLPLPRSSVPRSGSTSSPRAKTRSLWLSTQQRLTWNGPYRS